CARLRFSSMRCCASVGVGGVTVGGAGLGPDVDCVDRGATSVVVGYVHSTVPVVDTSCCSWMWKYLVCPIGHSTTGILARPSGAIATEPGVNGVRSSRPFTGIRLPLTTTKSTDQLAMCPSGADGSCSYERTYTSVPLVSLIAPTGSGFAPDMYSMSLVSCARNSLFDP